MAEHGLGGARPQRVCVIDAVAPGESGVDQRHRLVPDVGSSWGVTQVDVGVEQGAQTEMLRQCCRQSKPGVGDQPPVVEGHLDAVQGVR